MIKSSHINEKESDNSDSENNDQFDDDFDDYNSSIIFNNIENQNLEFSINDYVSKIRKKLLLIERMNLNKKEEDKKSRNQFHHGEKSCLALNLSQIPFMKFRINPTETMDEIIYIFSKKTRTLNEVIYLQHLLNLYEIKNFSNLKNDNFDINEVNLNISICSNLYQYQKNEIMFKNGNYNDKLFFLLSGGVTLLEPIEKKCYMSIEQYIDYLNQLIDIGEYELVRKIIDRNKLYKNNLVVAKIKNNAEKEIKRLITDNSKINKGINKLHNISSFEFSLNIESKLSFEYPREIKNQNEIISLEEYKKRVLPTFINEKENKKKKKLFYDNEENSNDISYINNKDRNKHVVVFYSYSIKEKLSPFNIIGEFSQDNENFEKSGINNQNKRKGEYSVTAICDEPSTIIFIKINTYEKFSKQRQESILMKNINSILEIPFFKGLNANIFKEKYFNFFTLYYYKNGEFIFKQDEKMNYIYFIKSGEIELTMESSMEDINNILENIKIKNSNELKQNDNIIRNNIKKKRIISQEIEENIEIMNKFKKDKRIMKWRIMRINYKDVICLNEILDLNNKYLMNAKCMSYTAEIFAIEEKKLYEMIDDDKGIKNLFSDYCIRKKNLIYERLNRIKSIYLSDKFKIYKNKLMKNLSLRETNIINYNNLAKKRNDIKLDLINNILENSLSAKNIHINSDGKVDTKRNNNEYPLEKEFLTISSKESNIKLRSAKYPEYKSKINSANRNLKSNEEFKTSRNTKKIKLKKAFSFFNDDEENNLLQNQRYNSENQAKVKIHKYKKSKSYLGLVKFKDFNKIIKTCSSTDKKYLKSNLGINPNFNKYLKEVKKYRLDSTKKPKINPFSRVFFPFQKDNINIKSNLFNFIGFSNELENFNFNKIECLVLDKFIDAKEYKKYRDKNEQFVSNKKNLSIKELKKNIKYMSNKNKFPQHLIRRLEGERKINYFPEKLLHFQNKNGRYFLG